MSLPEPKHPGYTIEDWQTWDGRWELIHGVPYAMTPSPSPEHQRVSFKLQKAIDAALDDARRGGDDGDCEILSAPLDLFLPGEQSVFQPDLVVVCDPAKITRRGIEGVPDLVAEILSPSTASKDMAKKRWAYEAAGIPEYLIVDPEEQYGLLLRLQGGRYEEAARVEWGAAVPLLGGKVSVPIG